MEQEASERFEKLVGLARTAGVLVTPSELDDEHRRYEMFTAIAAHLHQRMELLPRGG